MKKIFLIVTGILILVVAITAYMLWNKPHRNIAIEKGVAIEATQLSMEYENNQDNANHKYLDKVLEVTGVIKDISTNQDGNTVIVLDDIFSGVQCTMKDSSNAFAIDEVVTVRGICTGYTIGVLMSECILSNNSTF